MSARTILLAGALALVLAFAGCSDEGGGNGGAGTPAPKGPTAASKQDVIREADEICRAALTEAGGIRKPKSRQPRVVKRYIARLARVQQDAVTEIKALRPPPEGKAEFDKFISANEGLNESFDGLVKAVERRDRRGVARVSARIRTDSAKAQAAAEAYGFRVCGQTKTATG